MYSQAFRWKQIAKLGQLSTGAQHPHDFHDGCSTPEAHTQSSLMGARGRYYIIPIRSIHMASDAAEDRLQDLCVEMCPRRR